MQPTPMADGDDGWDDRSDISDEARLLSPEEYLEMMRYIEELCREEDLRAEAEVSYYTIYDSLRRLCLPRGCRGFTFSRFRPKEKGKVPVFPVWPSPHHPPLNYYYFEVVYCTRYVPSGKMR